MADQSRESVSGRHGAPGYVTSALIFAGLTALWAAIVRSDPYYRLTDLGGVRLPITMLAFLVIMPLVGFLIGRWRYHQPHRGGALTFAGRLVARGVNFAYAHTLIVLFTIAMIMDAFLGLNVDQQVKALDDRMFEAAARYAPWLCAYLAGFNLGRATRKEELVVVLAPAVPAESDASDATVATAEAAPPPEAANQRVKSVKPGKKRRLKKSRLEAVLGESPFLPSGALERGDFQTAGKTSGLSGESTSPHRSVTSSGLPHSTGAPTPSDAPGFLPPQDFDRLRPTLKDLR
ncbi:MAG: hypothetical protein HXY21_14425 [Parvularculaceae bacterium]|nr:hypothetical protein [Parvularculaceae bacterium]